MLSKGSILAERFEVNGSWEWVEGTVMCIRKSGQVVIKFSNGYGTYQFNRAQADSLKKVVTTLQPRQPVIKKRKKKSSVLPSKRAKSSYNMSAKTESPNKIMCRQAMVSDLSPRSSKLRALVLDAEDTQFSELLVTKYGVSPSNIDVPNCNGAEVVDAMNARGYATVHDSYLGDFVRSMPTQTKPYDLLFLDYCGMPGDEANPNTPLHDLRELFEGGFVGKRALLGVTVCLRSNAKTTVMYQNMHRMANAVTTAAFSNGYLSTTKMQTIYKDAGSQTMCFVCFYINKL